MSDRAIHWTWWLVGAGAVCAAAAVPASPAGAAGPADVVQQVSLDSYRDFLDDRLYARDGDNRGFWKDPAQGGIYVPTADHDAARDEVLGCFAGLGLAASLDPFGFVAGRDTYAGAYNVLGLLPGRIYPERIYVIGGHYDSVDNPGADDNASGVAGVLEAARVLAGQPLACSVLFAAWDGEEKGLRGSSHWVEDNDANQVWGVANLDMIAYNHDGDGNGQGDNVATVYGQSDWRQKWVSALGRYSPGIWALEHATDIMLSDHWPFQKRGRPAGGVIENRLVFPLPNPNYHTQADSVDTPGYLDYAYAVQLLRSAVGLIAEEAHVLIPGDADGNDVVDFADYLTTKVGFGTETGAVWMQGDFDADGDVDFYDYLVCKASFGQSLMSPSSHAPEPATWLLLLPIAAAGALRRSRRTRKDTWQGCRGCTG